MKLASIFTSHMVLQRNKPIRFWGTGSGPVTVNFDGEEVTALSVNGRWHAVFAPRAAGGPYTVSFREGENSVTLEDILIGEVWIAAGQSNMEHPTMAAEGGFTVAGAAENDQIRFFTVPHFTVPDYESVKWLFEPVLTRDTPWCLCTAENALHFSAIGFFFAVRLQKLLQVPVGIISCNQGATNVETWIPQEAIDTHPSLERSKRQQEEILEKLDLADYQKKFREHLDMQSERCSGVDAMGEARRLSARDYNRLVGIGPMPQLPLGPWDIIWPGHLYETMVSRIVGYGAKGVLWYQGESNSGTNYLHRDYAAVFGVMVEQWRQKWDDPMPFLTVQLAPFGTVVHPNHWPLLIQQQIDATRTISDVWMVTSSEFGEVDNIHPVRKEEFAHRLFLAAKKEIYGQDGCYAGPTIRNAQRERDGVLVSFDHTDGGIVCNGPVAELELCGEDGIYQCATGEIQGDKLFVRCEAVSEPRRVRLGNQNFFCLNLYNGAGLLAAPFDVEVCTI